MKKNRLIIGLFILFICLLSLTIYTSFSSNIDEQEIVIKSMVPVYDETSTIEVDNNNVVFNDKNQVVKYNVVLENTQDYDVKISDIKLSTPTEEFLDYKVEGIGKDDVLGASSTKELTISFETMGIKGWGRNFADELTANISFEKYIKQEEVVPPVEEDKEEEKQPEAPAASTEELISKTEKIEIIKVTKDTIEFKETPKLENGDKIAVWLYSDPVFLGYFDVVITNGIKKIVGLEEAIKKAEITPGEHNIVLATEEKEVLGYVEIYISENKELLSEKPQDTTEKEDEEGKIENPYTSDNGLLVILIVATGVTGLAITVVSKNKFAKYTVFILILSPAFTITNAEDPIELSINNNVSFESQNIMKPSGWEIDDTGALASMGVDYWAYAPQIKNFYIQNEITEIEEYEYEFDVTNNQSGRVMAYLVEYKDNSVCMDFDENDALCYDLYLQADGIIYPNEDASFYFFFMMFLNSINNLEGMDTSKVTDMSYMFNGTGAYSENFTLYLGDKFDTSNVTNMSGMFGGTGYSSTDFTLDLGDKFDTSNVTNMMFMFESTGDNSTEFTLDLGDKFDTSNVTDMKHMFSRTGYNSTDFTLDLGDKFDTSNVTDMNHMFESTGYNSTEFTLDLGDKFDTSNVTDMNNMFYCTGHNSTEFTLDLGDNFDTSNVTDMNHMFASTGYSSTEFTLDVSNFDTSKVTNMSRMFSAAGYSSPNFTLDVSNFDTSKVTNMSYMFRSTGYGSPNFTLDLSNFDTSNVTDMSYMFCLTGVKSTDFTLDLGDKFDTSNVTDMSYMFASTGKNSTKLNTSITISNPNMTTYGYMFHNVATKEGSQITVNYTSKTSSLVDKMIATKAEGANVVKGELVEIITDDIDIGDEIAIGSEHFNVVSQTDDTVTMFAQYNLGTDYRQSTDNNYVTFSNSSGWEYTPGPKEIDIQERSTNPKTYVNAYVEYLKTELGDDSVTGDLITLTELKGLGCTINDDYSTSSGLTCVNSIYKSWLLNSQIWWTCSSVSDNDNYVWSVYRDGYMILNYYDNTIGVRPVVTISKEALKKLN